MAPSLLMVVMMMFIMSATYQVSGIVQFPVPGLPSSQPDHKGRLFCTAFLENTPGGEGNLGQMRLYVTTDEPNPIQFRIDFGSGPPFNQMSIPSASGTVMPNQYTMVNVPSIVELGSTGGENGHLTYGVQIVGINGAISVYAVHDDQKSCDGWLVLPQEGHPDVSRYRYVTFSSLLDAGDQFTRNTIFAVPICYDQTPSPSLTLSMTVPNEYPMTPEHEINLGNFIVLGGKRFTPGTTVPLNVFSTVRTSFFISGPKPDLTGWRVSTNHQVGVVTGHACGRAPVTATACDHLAEQIPPTYTWGYHVFTAPQSQRFGEMYRIQSRGVAAVDVTCTPANSSVPNPTNKQTIDPNGNYFYEFVTNQPKYCCIESEEPIVVMQYAVGHSYDENNPNKTHRELGDPFMILIPPVEQYINNVTFTTDLRVNDQFNRGDYISVTVPIQYFNSSMIMLDGNDLSVQQWHKIFCSDGGVCGMGTNMAVGRAFHRMVHLDPNAVFFVAIYGWGNETSWGVPGGYARRPVGLPIFRFLQQETRVSENVGSVQVTLVRSGDTRTEASIVVSIRTSSEIPPGFNRANIPNDVPLFSRTITFSVGTTSQDVSIPIVNDTSIESIEVFEAHLTKVTTPNSPDVVVGVLSFTNIVIVDDDAIVATFERDIYRFNEDVGTQTVVIILNRISSINIPLKISTSPNSADGSSDYVAIPADTIISIPAGSTRGEFNITILDDNVYEATESFTAQLAVAQGQTPSGVIVGYPNSVTLEIMDNDKVTVPAWSSITIASVISSTMTTAQLIVTLMSPSVAPTHVIATPTAYTTIMRVPIMSTTNVPTFMIPSASTDLITIILLSVIIMILIVVIVVIIVSVIVIYYMKKQKRKPLEYDYVKNYSLSSNLNARDHIVGTSNNPAHGMASGTRAGIATTNNPAYEMHFVSEPTQPSDYPSPVRKSPSSEPTQPSDLCSVECMQPDASRIYEDIPQ